MSALDQGGVAPRPGHITSKNDPIPTILEAAWAPGSVWGGGGGAKNFAPNWIQSTDRPARSKFIYCSYRKSDPSFSAACTLVTKLVEVYIYVYVYVYLCMYIYIYIYIYIYVFFLLWRCDPKRVMASSFLRFLDHTQRRTTVGRTSLDEWSARRRDLYLTTHNTRNRQISMSPVPRS